MSVLEALCGAIVVVYVAARLVLAKDRAGFLVRFVLVAVAGFVSEDTVIRAYGFYRYSDRLSAHVDQVPLLIVLVWPVVIDSALALASAFARSRAGVALATAGIVLADASLIEPISVRAGLWTWTEPGMFHVPIVGVFGWAFFAAAAAFLLQTTTRSLLVVAAPIAVHVMLVASWWLVFRWTRGPLPDTALVVAAWVASAALTAAAWRRPLATRASQIDLVLRAPGAVFFFFLLARLASRADAALVLYALAFAPPYAALLRLLLRRFESLRLLSW